MQPSKPIYAVVLAAGRSQRFGDTKLTAELDGEPLVRRALTTARTAFGDNVLLVAGHEASRIIDAAGDAARFIAINGQFANGMGTSIAAAARALDNRASAMLLTLADQPLITPEHLVALRDAWDGDANSIVATAFAGTQGPPVVLPQASFSALKNLDGDEGARHLLRNSRFRVTTVWNDAAAVDIDTREDLDQAAS